MKDLEISPRFKRLAETLAANHVFLSVDSAQYKSACRRVLKINGARGQRPRVVAVIGAGASYAACGLPLSEDAASHLENQLLGGNQDNKTRLEEEIERLRLEYNQQRADF